MMNRTFVLVLALAACGGGKKSSTTPPATGATMDKKDEAPAEPATPEKPAEPAKPAEAEKPPAPKMFHAKASLAPVKGAKQKAATITFAQEEGKPTTVTSSLDGLKPGKYHLVVHEAKDCGPNATKAGKPFAPAASADIGFEAKKDGANVDASGVDVKLSGDDSVVGHVLVLNDDKKGKPGKALACGPITAADDEDDAAKK